MLLESKIFLSKFLFQFPMTKRLDPGNKTQDKLYQHHTGYPGGLKTINFEKLQNAHPERIIEKAVKGMLPKNPLGRAMFGKLKVYAGAEHPHAAQQPKELSLKYDVSIHKIIHLCKKLDVKYVPKNQP